MAIYILYNTKQTLEFLLNLFSSNAFEKIYTNMYTVQIHTYLKSCTLTYVQYISLWLLAPEWPPKVNILGQSSMPL